PPARATQRQLHAVQRRPERRPALQRTGRLSGSLHGGGNPGFRCATAAECPEGNCGPPGTCGGTVCVGGTNAGNACTSDAGCPGGECGPSLFDFSGALLARMGPVLLSRFGAGVCQGRPDQTCLVDTDCGTAAPCVVYALTAQTPVPLEGL